MLLFILNPLALASPFHRPPKTILGPSRSIHPSIAIYPHAFPGSSSLPPPPPIDFCRFLFTLRSIRFTASFCRSFSSSSPPSVVAVFVAAGDVLDDILVAPLFVSLASFFSALSSGRLRQRAPDQVLIGDFSNASPPTSPAIYVHARPPRLTRLQGRGIESDSDNFDPTQTVEVQFSNKLSFNGGQRTKHGRHSSQTPLIDVACEGALPRSVRHRHHRTPCCPSHQRGPR